MAINTDFMVCAPKKIGKRSFFSPKARNPSPKPVRKELFPPSSETQIHILTSPNLEPKKVEKTVTERKKNTLVRGSFFGPEKVFVEIKLLQN
jgi:hypothetical protein